MMLSGSNTCFAVFNSTYATLILQVIWLSNIIFIAVSPDLNRLVFRQIHLMSIPEILALGFNVFCVLVLIVEIFSGMVAIGFKRWLVISVYHKTDLAILVVCFVEGVGGLFGILLPTLRPFRILRVFKHISMFKVLPGFDMILETLQRCSGQIATIALICLSLFAFFSILAMAIFQKSFSRTCVLREHAVPSCASDFSTSWSNTCTNKDFVRQAWSYEDGGRAFIASSGYPSDMPCKFWPKDDPLASGFENKYPVDSKGQHHTCQHADYRKYGASAVMTECRETGNPAGGFMHFDHAGGALIVIIQTAIPDAHYEVLTRALLSEPSAGEAE